MHAADIAAWRVRKLAPADLRATARLLARAFMDNPMYAHMHPRAAHRAFDLERFFARNLSWHAGLDLTWVVVDRDDGVAGTVTLEPPGGIPHSFTGLVRHWVIPTLREQGPHTVSRIARMDSEFGRRYRALSGGAPYWHVHAVAVDPDKQGKGAGTTMLTQVFRELDVLVDERPAPVLISTQRERNVALYRRFGFELLNEQTFGGCRSWFMRRATT